MQWSHLRSQVSHRGLWINDDSKIDVKAARCLAHGGQSRRGGLAQSLCRGPHQQSLPSMASAQAGKWRRSRPQELDTGFTGLTQTDHPFMGRALHGRDLVTPPAEHDKSAERRESRSPSFDKLILDKSIEVLLGSGLQYGLVRQSCLNHNLTWLITSTRSTCNLRQKLKTPLRSPEIGHV